MQHQKPQTVVREYGERVVLRGYEVNQLRKALRVVEDAGIAIPGVADVQPFAVKVLDRIGREPVEPTPFQVVADAEDDEGEAS